VSSDQFDLEYGRIFEGDEKWKSMPAPTGTLFDWAGDSTYVREPPFFIDFASAPAPASDIAGARALAVLGDSITTDHISPAGSDHRRFASGEVSGRTWVSPAEFNSFGSRRGNHEVMMRGTFGNIRLRNLMAARHRRPVDRACAQRRQDEHLRRRIRYQQERTPLVVIAGREYGSGSSRDWAAKGAGAAGHQGDHRRELRTHPPQQPRLHGRASAAIQDGDSAKSLGLTGTEPFSITGIAAGIKPRQEREGFRDPARWISSGFRCDSADRCAGRGRVFRPRRHPAEMVLRTEQHWSDRWTA
jgi:aconitate hydratase